MSRITSVVSVAKTLTAPFEPAGTMAALDLTLPSIELSVATSGWDCPEGHRVRYPSVPRGTTATFREYPAAVDAMPQALLGITKSRDAPPAMAGPPKGPLEFLVSAIRQGVTGTKSVAEVWAIKLVHSWPTLALATTTRNSFLRPQLAMNHMY